MKILFFCLALFLFLQVKAENRSVVKVEPKLVSGDSTSQKWRIIFKEDFKSKGMFDQKKWSYSPRGKVAWNKFLTSSADYVNVKKGKLVLRMDDQKIEGDPVPYHSGGISTFGKFSFLYGKVEVRARLKHGQGSWPAIWMMPEKSEYGDWPYSGEIDIMEHLNHDTLVYQTIHNGAVTAEDGGSSASWKSPFKVGEFNVYGIVWTENALEFYVNGTHYHTYKRPKNATSKEWPFDKPYYLILNQSGGAGWPGPIVDSDLPFQMDVDWVKVYQAY